MGICMTSDPLIKSRSHFAYRRYLIWNFHIIQSSFSINYLLPLAIVLLQG